MTKDEQHANANAKVDPELFETDAERELWRTLCALERWWAKNEGDYYGLLMRMGGGRP